MSRFKNIWYSVFKRRSTHFIDLVIAVTLIVQGLYELIPGLQVPHDELIEHIGNERAEVSLAMVQLVAGGLFIYHFFSGNALAGRIATFTAFLVFSFLGLLGFLADVNALYWLMAGCLAFVCGAMHIRLGWNDRE